MDVVDRIRDTLANAGDPERADAQQAYMKSTLPYRGITSPELKTLLRPILVDWHPSSALEWEIAIRTLWDEVQWREEWYAALALLRHRRGRDWLTPEVLPLLGDLISTGAWWDVVDEIASHPLGDTLARFPQDVTPVMRE